MARNHFWFLPNNNVLFSSILIRPLNFFRHGRNGAWLIDPSFLSIRVHLQKSMVDGFFEIKRIKRKHFGSHNIVSQVQ